MKLVNKQNELLALAAVVVVMMGIMAYTLFGGMKSEETAQLDDTETMTVVSKSTETEDIEHDVEQTDFTQLDAELSTIEAELNLY